MKKGGQRKYLRKLSIKLIKGKYSSISSTIINPQQLYGVFRGISKQYQENLLGIYFDNDMRIIAYDILSVGSTKETIYCPDEILKRAILLNSKRFIIIHNHPSGDSNPSNEDKDIMIDLRKRAKILDIILLDFLIIGDPNKDRKYYSIFEEMEGGDYLVGDVDWGIRGNEIY